MIRREFDRLLIAIQFLTIFPVPRSAALEDDWLPRSAKYFPLVGALIGLLAGMGVLLAAMVFPDPVPMVLGLSLVTLLTGALHEDGLADSADGLLGGRERAQRLEIMKDSRVGTYGVMALLICFALKGAGFLSLPPVTVAVVLVASLALSRLAAVLTMAGLRYAGETGVSKLSVASRGMAGHEVGLAFVLGLLPGLSLLRFTTLAWAAVMAFGAAALVAFVARKKIGGYTGDVLGAVEQVSQAVFIIVAAALINGPG